MPPVITIKGIEEAIANLNYRNQNSPKYLLIQAIRGRYMDEASIQSIESIDTESLIRSLWKTGHDEIALRNRRKNLNSIKSSVNADLRRLYDADKNPEGIMISPSNTFVMSDEAKDSALEALRGGIDGEGETSLAQLGNILKTLKEFLAKSGGVKDFASGKAPGPLNELRKLMRALSEDMEMGDLKGGGGRASTGSMDTAEGGTSQGVGDTRSGSMGKEGSEMNLQEAPLESSIPPESSGEDLESVNEVGKIEGEIEPAELEEVIEDLDPQEDLDGTDLEEFEIEEAVDELEEIEEAAALEPVDEVLDELEDQEDESEEIEEEDLLENFEAEEILEGDEETEGEGAFELLDPDGTELEEIEDDVEELEVIDAEDQPAEETMAEDLSAMGEGGSQDGAIDAGIEGKGLGIPEDIEERDPETAELESVDEISEDVEDQEDDLEEIEEEDLLEDSEVEEIDVDEIEEVGDGGISEIDGEGTTEESEGLEEADDDDLADEDYEVIEQESEGNAQEAEEDFGGTGDPQSGETAENGDTEGGIDLPEILNDFRETELLAGVEESGRLLSDQGEENLNDVPGEKWEKDNSGHLSEQFNHSLAAMDRFFNQYILIPKGKYTIGEKGPGRDDRSEQSLDLPAFYFGKFPVTNALFEVFVEKTGFKTIAEKLGYGTVYHGREKREVDEETGLQIFSWSSALTSKIVEGACWYQPLGPGSTLHNKRNHPVVQISLEDAMAFAAWTGKRLPTEDEWEAASRTEKGCPYPWGEKWREGLCNVEATSIGDTTSVDRFLEQENSLGIADALGNVLEWTSSPIQGQANSNGRHYIAKGGSWVSSRPLNLADRFVLDAESHSNILGFRCVAY